MTVKELIDAVHRKVLHSFSRGNEITGYDKDMQPLYTEDHTDHWSREATVEDVKTVSDAVAKHAAELQKG